MVAPMCKATLVKVVKSVEGFMSTKGSPTLHTVEGRTCMESTVPIEGWP